MNLAIISHTEHYKTKDGTVVGWSPTVNEINHLLEVFDSIIHVAMLYDGEPPKSTMAYSSNQIRFVPIPSVGGHGVLNKLKIVYNAPKIFKIVSKVLKEVDYFQLRTPAGIGVFLIPYLTFFSRKKGWFKYAGNWNQKNAPLGYALQRWMLKQQRRKVTINGRWLNQPKHCLSFENPCLTEDDIAEGRCLGTSKSVEGPIRFCFVGRLEKEKGVGRIIRAVEALSPVEKQRIESLEIVGDGKDRVYFEELASNVAVACRFYGALPRQEVFEIYKRSHIFILPSTASEGFPKVIAEALNFGCIPVVSGVSSITQYIIPEETGFLVEQLTIEYLKIQMTKTLRLKDDKYRAIIQNGEAMLKRFSYAHYNRKVKSELLKDKMDKP